MVGPEAGVLGLAGHSGHRLEFLQSSQQIGHQKLFQQRDTGCECPQIPVSWEGTLAAECGQPAWEHGH